MESEAGTEGEAGAQSLSRIVLALGVCVAGMVLAAGIGLSSYAVGAKWSGAVPAVPSQAVSTDPTSLDPGPLGAPPGTGSAPPVGNPAESAGTSTPSTSTYGPAGTQGTTGQAGPPQSGTGGPAPHVGSGPVPAPSGGAGQPDTEAYADVPPPGGDRSSELAPSADPGQAQSDQGGEPGVSGQGYSDQPETGQAQQQDDANGATTAPATDEERRAEEEARRASDTEAQKVAAALASMQEQDNGSDQGTGDAMAAARAAAEAVDAQRSGSTGTSGSSSAVSPIAPGAYRLTSRFGALGLWSRYHTGVDLGARLGTPVRAAAAGVVQTPVAGGWAGTHVIIDHGDGSTLSAHLGAATVTPGQQVRAGDVIGYVGMTGRTFGPHLHFEYYPRGRDLQTPYSATDPLVWLSTKGVRP